MYLCPVFKIHQMKKIFITAVLGIYSWAFSQEVPKILKTEFSPKALQQQLLNQKGNKETVKKILEKHKGKVLLIDFWASWCKDCIAALPKTNTILSENPNIAVVYFSLDRNEEQWKKGLEKYKLNDKENYWFQDGWKNDFNHYIDLNWIPRFIIVDQKGKIAKYYAITPDDPEIQQTIDKLLN